MKYKFILMVMTSLMFVNPATADRKASSKAINQAMVLIETAERNGASKHAPYLLKTSRDNLGQANTHLENRDWVEAEVSAKMAQRDAEVADAKAQAGKAQKSYNDLKVVVDLLKSELERKRSMQ